MLKKILDIVLNLGQNQLLSPQINKRIFLTNCCGVIFSVICFGWIGVFYWFGKRDLATLIAIIGLLYFLVPLTNAAKKPSLSRGIFLLILLLSMSYFCFVDRYVIICYTFVPTLIPIIFTPKEKRQIVLATALVFINWSIVAVSIEQPPSFFFLPVIFTSMFAVLASSQIFSFRNDHVEEALEAKTVQVQNQIMRLKEIQNELVQREKMATIGLLAASVAHQLGNTLNSISAAMISTNRLIKKGLLDATAVSEANEITQEALNLARKIIQGLDLASKKNVTLQECHLNSIVDTSIVLMKGKILERVAVKNNIDTQIKAFVSRHSLIQIFMNLLSNSTDALGKRADGIVEISAMMKDNSVEVIYKDNAGGIPEKIRNALFQPYSTTKNEDEGSGFGMYIISEEIKGNNGTIKVNHIDGGTEFIMYFPAKEPVI